MKDPRSDERVTGDELVDTSWVVSQEVFHVLGSLLVAQVKGKSLFPAAVALHEEQRQRAADVVRVERKE